MNRKLRLWLGWVWTTTITALFLYLNMTKEMETGSIYSLYTFGAFGIVSWVVFKFIVGDYENGQQG